MEVLHLVFKPHCCLHLRLIVIGVMCFAASAVATQERVGGSTHNHGTDSSHAHTLEFEVVSIKPTRPGVSEGRIFTPLDGDEFDVEGFPLWLTIELAYFPRALMQRERLQGAPDWVWNDRYDFEAKVGETDLAEWQTLLQHQNPLKHNEMLEGMLQVALTARCKLVVRRIPSEVPGYALEVGTNGPNRSKLKTTSSDEPIPTNAQGISEDAGMIPILSPDKPVLQFFHTSIEALTAMLSRYGAPVIDKTGLTGKYDFNLLRLNTLSDPRMDWDVNALGLVLKPVKVPTETLVIEHIDRPSTN